MEVAFALEGARFQALRIVQGRIKGNIQAHRHGQGGYEVHYIIEGKGRLEVEGRVYHVKKGDFFVTGPGIEHAQYPDLQEPMEEYCVFLHCKDNKESLLAQRFRQTTFWFGQGLEEMGSLLEKIVKEQEEQRIGYKSRMQVLLADMVIQLVRCYELRQDMRSNREQYEDIDRTPLTIDEIFLALYDHLTLEELAKRLNRSPRQTQRMLKKYYDKNFQQKKTEARMVKASMELQQTDKHIYQIAEELGYSSPEHFSNAFQKYYGVRPSEYRK